MKLIAQLLVAALAVAVAAAPVEHLQSVMIAHLPEFDIPPEQEQASADSLDPLKTPPTVDEESLPVSENVPLVVPGSAEMDDDKWPGEVHGNEEHGEEEDKPWPMFTCFCAAGSICCHMPEGVGCGYGSCST